MNFYIYKLVHKETNEFYIGSRGCECLPEEDIKYFGSMSVWKPEKSKLIKIILLSNFKNREEAIIKEAELIKENIDNKLNRNYHIPHKGYHVSNMITAKDKEGNTYCVSINDVRIKTGELVGVNKGKIPVKDKFGNTLQVSINDIRYLNGELKHTTVGMFPAKDNNGNIFMICKNDIRFLNGELVSVNKGMVTVKDKSGNKLQVDKFDERYLNGELVSIYKGLPARNKGVPMSEAQKEKLRKPKSEEHKKNIAKARKNMERKKIICLTNGIIYDSMRIAAEELKLTIPNIVNVLKGRAEKTKGYSFKYL